MSADASLNELAARAGEGIRRSFAEFRSSVPEEDIYGFGFYSHQGSYLTMTAYTEQGLDEVAADYCDGGKYTDLQDMKRQLRWSPCDSPHHTAFEYHLEPAHELCAAATEAHGVTAVYDTLIEVLRRLDAEGVFGPDREQIVLNIWEGDQSAEARIDLAKRCNPPEIAARFAREELAQYGQP